MSGAALAPVLRWTLVKEPLSGWRDDDPDAYPRCSLNPEHVIRNGDHYAISGIKFVCLPCAQLSPPPAPEPVKPRPQPTRISPIDRQFGGGASRPERQPEKRQCAREGCGNTFPVRSPSSCQRFCSKPCVGKASRKERPAPASPPTTAEAPQQPRMSLGPAAPDYGKPVESACERPARVRFREERICARVGCGQAFVATSSTKEQRYHDQACSTQASANARRKEQPSAPVGQAVVQPAACWMCGGAFVPTTTRPDHCSWACQMRAAASPPDHGERCCCFGCAERRREQGLAPLIGVQA